MIPFNRASVTELECECVKKALMSSHLSGDGEYTFKCYEKIRELFGIDCMLLTTSGTTALEMASLLIGLEPGDEVITPPFTFSSTANAFMLRRAVPVFCDIREDTMNIDENRIENLITNRTKAIYSVDYAGIPCEYDKICVIADKYGLYLIEDAAQSIGSRYNGRFCGTFGDFGCFSFHETKNLSMGEGGGLVINDRCYLERAEIIREKGTNRRQVIEGMADKYTWHDIGSSFLPSDVLAAILYAQLERYNEITQKRVRIWEKYHDGLKQLEDDGLLRRACVPDGIIHNGHMYNIILPNETIRSRLVEELKKKEIYAYICYVPLHSSPQGMKSGYKPEMCPITEDYGKRVLRLPLFADMSDSDTDMVISEIDRVLRRG